MIGIAVGNDEAEIKKFRDHFQVPYPIVSDPKYLLHEAVGGPPAPFAIIVRKEPGAKSALVADTHLGFNSDMSGLFKQLQSLVRSDASDPSAEKVAAPGTFMTRIIVRMTGKENPPCQKNSLLSRPC